MDLLSLGIRSIAEMLTRHGGLVSGGGTVSLKAAQAGVRIHKHIQNVQAGRHPDYRSEKAVLHFEAAPEDFPAEIPGFTLDGRIDGIYQDGDTLVIDEIKSQERLPEGENETHFAQGIIYGFISTGSMPEDAKVRVDVIYAAFSDPDTVRIFSRELTAKDCRDYFKTLSDRYFSYLKYVYEHLKARAAQAAELKFPFEAFREGQRELARRVYDIFFANNHIRAMCQAPTGIGKTAGVLYPALKCLHVYKNQAAPVAEAADEPEAAGKPLEFRRIFYLTARNEGARPAETLINTLVQGEFPELTAVSLTAKERLCPLAEEGKDFSCDTNNCPYAAHHYDNADKAMLEALTSGCRFFTRTRLLELAERHSVCPFEFMLDLSLFSDVIIGDYNYLFDSTAYLHRFFDEDYSDTLLLIDEAHELPDRIRSMYSPELSAERFARNAVGRKRSKLGKLLSRISGEIAELTEPFETDVDELADNDSELHTQLALPLPDSGDNKESRDVGAENISRKTRGNHGKTGDIEPVNNILHAFPDVLISDLDRFCQLFMEEGSEETSRAKSGETGKGRARDTALDQLFFDTLRFVKTYDLYDEEHFRCCASLNVPETGKEGRKYHTVKLHCIDPAGICTARTGSAAGTVFFSGTLLPAPYFRPLLSETELPYYAFGSPFPRENLQVLAGVHIDTRYKVRESSVPVLAELTENLFMRLGHGNFMVYFPSYAYMNSVYNGLEESFKENFVSVQPRSTSLKAREEFISGFKPAPDSLHIGFCVMGGSFSEGLDLPGDRLSGVVIVGTGMPQVGFSNDLIRDTYDSKGGELTGFDCAYFYPGLNKVIQAGGRVIRTPSDKGFILLCDTRYASRRTRDSLPEHWDLKLFRDNENIISSLVDFIGKV